jgi:hypothetical protein
MKFVKGGSLLNTVLNKLPIPEMHMKSKKGGENVPGGSFNNTSKYSYCGPGTKLQKRIKQGYKGVNSLDRACQQHDIAYATDKDTRTRNKADDVLAAAATRIVMNANLSEAERSEARGVAAIMSAKSKLGMGLQKKPAARNDTK